MIEIQTRQSTKKIVVAKGGVVKPSSTKEKPAKAVESPLHEKNHLKMKLPPCTSAKKHSQAHDSTLNHRPELRERVRLAIGSLNQISQRVTERIAATRGEEKAVVDKAYNKELLQTGGKKSELYKYTGEANHSQGTMTTPTTTSSINKSSLSSQVQVFIQKLQSLNLLAKATSLNETRILASSVNRAGVSTAVLTKAIRQPIKQLGGLGTRFKSALQIGTIVGLGIGGAKIGALLGGLVGLLLPGIGAAILATFVSVLGLLGGCFLGLKLAGKIKSL